MSPRAHGLDLTVGRSQAFLGKGNWRILRHFHSFVAARYHTHQPPHYDPPQFPYSDCRTGAASRGR